MMYCFERLINKYGVTNAVIFAQMETEGHYDDDTGKWVKPQTETSETPLTCVIVPMSTKMVTDSGGRYTTNDRQLYTRTRLQEKQTVKYRGVSYTVEEETDYTEYADFFVYVIKAVSTFDKG